MSMVIDLYLIIVSYAKKRKRLIVDVGIVLDVIIIDVRNVSYWILKRKQKWKIEEKDYLMLIL